MTPNGTTDIHIELNRKPDYRYRLDYLFPSSQAREPPVPKPIPPPPTSGGRPDERKAAMDTFNAATGNYRTHLAKPGKEDLIGRNNLSEITFEWGARDSAGDHKKVNHTVRWRTLITDDDNDAPDPELAGTFVVWTNYNVDLNPDEQFFYHSYLADKEGP